MKLIFVVKWLSTIALFVVFLTIFGLSSIQKYMQRDIVTVSRTEPSNGCLPAPAIMVCPEGEYGGAWKEDCMQHWNNLTKMDVCSREYAYTMDETIIGTSVMARNGAQRVSINLSSWTPTYTTPYVGTCYKLMSRQNCLNSGETLSILFTVGGVKSHSIYLFDPKFFMLVKDNSVIPFLLLENPISKSISIHPTITTKINRPKFPCNPDQSYSYNHCVRTSLAKRIGCKYPFYDSSHILNAPNCNITEELVAHWTANFDIFSANQQQLLNITGCELPCNYYQYSIVGTPRKYEVKGQPYIELFYTSTDITSSQEVLLYPFDSFVSEFGGALGLFLGFSFLGLLDIIQFGCTNLLTMVQIDNVPFTLPEV